jgi:hypothetical protein
VLSKSSGIKEQRARLRQSQCDVEFDDFQVVLLSCWRELYLYAPFGIDLCLLAQQRCELRHSGSAIEPRYLTPKREGVPGSVYGLLLHATKYPQIVHEKWDCG